MTQKWQSLKLYIKGLELSYSDLFLALGFLFAAPFYALSWQFMVTKGENVGDIFFKPWMMIVCFTITVICWGFYFYLEIKKGHIKNNLVTWLYVFFALFSIITVLVQPTHSEIDVLCRNGTDFSRKFYPGVQTGDYWTIVTDISSTHRLFFTFASFLITTIFFIIFMVLPKRIKHLEFLIFIGLSVFTFLFILTVYSYITESSNYVGFMKALFIGDIDGIYDNSVKSFIVHRVPYGACMMMGVIFGLTIHSFTKKWYWYLPTAYCFINMIFSWCKTSIALTVLIVFLYIVYRLIATFKEHKKRNLITLIAIGSVVFIGIILVVVSLITKGKFLPYIYKIIGSFTDTRTIDTRTYIWENIKQRLSGGWWLIGRGFGTHNYMLYPMNLLNGDDVCPSHSTFYATLGAGGIVFLLGLIALYGYYVYAFIKCWKVDKVTTVGLATGVLAFTIYSFTESVNYLLVVFMFPLILYYNIIKRTIN